MQTHRVQTSVKSDQSLLNWDSSFYFCKNYASDHQQNMDCGCLWACRLRLRLHMRKCFHRRPIYIQTTHQSHLMSESSLFLADSSNIMAVFFACKHMVLEARDGKHAVMLCLYTFACKTTCVCVCLEGREDHKRKKRPGQARIQILSEEVQQRYQLVNSTRQQRKCQCHAKIMRKHEILHTVWVHMDVQYFTPRLHSNSTKRCIFMSRSFTSDSKWGGQCNPLCQSTPAAIRFPPRLRESQRAKVCL